MSNSYDEGQDLMRKADQAAYEYFSEQWSASFAILEAFVKAGYSPAEIEDTLRPLWKELPQFRFVRSTCEILSQNFFGNLHRKASKYFNELPIMRGES